MEQTIAVEIDNSTYTFSEDNKADHNLEWLSDNVASIIQNNRSAVCRTVQICAQTKTVTIECNGKTYHAKILEPADMQVKSMGYATTSAKVLHEIKAPMPGLVLEMNIREGEMYEAGTRMLVLEAMKMENVITLPSESRIKKVLVKKGDAVDKNQVLVELDNGKA